MFSFIAWKAIRRYREYSVHYPILRLNDDSYTERTPRPANPILRPAYQGSNPVADIFSLWALKATIEYLPRIHKNGSSDYEARKQML